MSTLSTLATESDRGNFVPVRLTTLEALDEVPCDLYVEFGQAQPTLWRASEIAITASDFKKLRSLGIEFAYVCSNDSPRMQKAISEGLETVLHDGGIAPEDRFGFLQTAVSLEINQAFQMINVNAAVERSADIGEKIANLLQGGDTLPSDVFGVVRHDYYTFTHITNVSAYAVLLAESLGITDADELNAIATGALLHDIGKRMISPTILNKQKRPSANEWKIIEAHPQTGFVELHDRNDLNHAQLMMVYQHHEKLDGTGYPVRAADDDIHPWAQLCAVVDIFDAMTCNRPYRRAMKLSDVLAYMEDLAGSQLNPEMVSCWTTTMRTNK